MYAIPPITPTIISSSVSEPSAAVPAAGFAAEVAWVSGAHALGEQRTYSGIVYECSAAVTSSVTPDNDPDHWFVAGVTNKQAMFDLYRNTQTIAASPLVVVIEPNRRINSIAFLKVDAKQIDIVMKVGSTVIQTRSIDLNARRPLTWSDYLLAEFITKANIVLFDLPMISNIQIEITISSNVGYVKCGGIGIGAKEFIGDMESGADNDVLNFSMIDRNAFGNATLKSIPNVPKTDQVLLVPQSLIPRLIEFREKHAGKPVIWAGIHNIKNPLFDAFLICGPYNKFSISPATPLSRVNLGVEEI